MGYLLLLLFLRARVLRKVEMVISPLTVGFELDSSSDSELNNSIPNCLRPFKYWLRGHIFEMTKLAARVRILSYFRESN